MSTSPQHNRLNCKETSDYLSKFPIDVTFPAIQNVNFPCTILREDRPFINSASSYLHPQKRNNLSCISVSMTKNCLGSCRYDYVRFHPKSDVNRPEASFTPAIKYHPAKSVSQNDFINNRFKTAGLKVGLRNTADIPKPIRRVHAKDGIRQVIYGDIRRKFPFLCCRRTKGNKQNVGLRVSEIYPRASHKSFG